ADCTDVRVREGKIVFSRPARGGNTVADIECTRSPVMATLRTGKKTGGLVADVGFGALGCLDKIRKWCETQNGMLMASRAAVDHGKLPYAIQIGLTGRAVAPDTLVVFGVSGAVQHTCAVEGAGTIIAVNPDKNARIFDYADYGFVARAEEIQL
ncbi:MAG: FAD-binding protein, partial [Clostridiales bacterium]|nr:FAD-binding protein [Clostridiales bacterium]